MDSTFEDGQELAMGGKAGAVLGAFGFEGDVRTATHFYYKLDVSKRVSQIDTAEYVACCKNKGTCGYGFVSALIYGDGQYATAVESSAEANLNIPVAGGVEGVVKAKILHRRKVHGYVAALVTVTDGSKAKTISVIGDSAAAGIGLAQLPETVREVYDSEKLSVVRSSDSYYISDRRSSITENEFVRRYARVTDSNELSPFNQSRSRTETAIAVTLLATGVAAGVLGVSLLATEPSPTGSFPNGTSSTSCDSNTNAPGCSGWGAHFVGGVASLSVGLVGAGVGTYLLIVALPRAEGKPTDHAMSEGDARIYVTRYNRALLRKTMRDAEKAYQSTSLSVPPASVIAVKPVVSPGFTGIVGTF